MLISKDMWDNCLATFSNLDSDDDFVLCGEAAYYPWIECSYDENNPRYTHKMFNFDHCLWRNMVLEDFNSCYQELNGAS